MIAQVRHDSSLEEKHTRELSKKRGLPVAWCEANCRSVTAKEASDLLGYKALSGGIWLYGENIQAQFKPDTPWKNEGDKRAPKYRSPLGWYDAMLPQSPTEARYWSDTESLKEKCYIVDGHPCVVVTEGFFKAISGCAIGVPTVALIGVEMGLTPKADDPQGKRYLVESLEKLARAGFGFIHAFDADCAMKPEVIAAQRKLCHQISKFSVPQYIATGLWTVDEGKGMDDYIQKNGEEAFRKEVLAKSVSFELWEAQFRTPDEKEKKVSQQTLSMEIIEKYRDVLAWHVPNKAWYWYEQPIEGRVIPGVWAEVPDEVIGYMVVTEAMKHLTHFNHDLIAGTMRLLKYHLKVVYWETKPGYVCLKDCVLEVETLKEYPHQPGYRFLSALPYCWSDREVGCDPVKAWLLEACEGRHEWVEVIRAAMNATLTERAGKLQRFMELIGFGGTGKGTIIRLTTALVGKENVAVTDLKQLEKNRFETASLYSKKAVIITDSERYAGDVATLKALTGQDLIRYEKKGVQQTQGYRYHGMVWIAANEAIQSADYTSGLKRRRLSMPFNRVVPPHKRRDLEREFEPYLPGVLHWVLSMPEEDVVSYVRDTDSKVPSLKGFQAEVLLETNPIALWADTSLVLSPGAKTYVGNKGMDASQYLFASYSAWAEGAGYNPVSQARFSRNLLDLLKSQLGVTDVEKGRGNKGAYIQGVMIRLPGMESWERLITGDGLEAKSDGHRDGLVTGQVMPETVIETDSERSDGFLPEKISNVPLTVSPSNDPPSEERKDKHMEQISLLPTTLPQDPSQTDVSPVTLPVTGDESAHKNPSLLLQVIVTAWDDIYELGTLVLSAPEEELVEVARKITPEQVEHIVKAADYVWKPGLNRDASYKGERVEIWEAGLGRSVTVRTRAGSMLKVKRGDLTPWLGL
jgi:putative DNA primase/helicase